MLDTGRGARLTTETLEARCLLAADFDVGVRLETTDLAGSQIASVEIGQPFLLNAYVQDIRDVIDPAPGGIFSAYFDVEYNPALASVDLKETQSVLLEGFPTGGSFTLTFEGQTTADIPITATAADVETALEALSTLDASEVDVFQPSFDQWTVRFGGDWVNQNVPELVPDAGGLLGGTNPNVVVAQVTGVSPTNILDVIASINYGPNYPDRHRGSINPVGTLDEIGAARFATGGLGPVEQLFFQVQFTADAAGTLDFMSNAAEDISNETLIVAVNSIVPADRIEFGTTSIDVVNENGSTASVGDRVWQDLNLDGLQSAGEPGLQGVQVEIFNVGAGGAIGDGDDFSAGSTTTDIDGLYTFGDLPSGNYYLMFSDVPANFEFAQQDSGVDDTLDSDVNPSNGRTDVFALSLGDNNTTLDAALVHVSAPITTRFDMRVVLDPTSTDADGQVEVLPEGREWIHEWHRYWIEVWVSTPGSTSAGFTSATINVDYDTTTFTATSVESGAAFAGGLTSTINDTTGQVELAGNVTSAEVVGADQFVLLARIQMESTNADAGLPVDLGGPTSATSISQPWLQFTGDGNAAAQLDSAPADIEVSDPPSTGLYPMPYDLDDDGSIKFGDLAIFSSLFLQNVADTQDARKADFDQDGRVAFGDLALLSASFLKGRSDGNDIFMPLNFPTGSEPSTAAASISTASAPPSETAASLAANSPVAGYPLSATQFSADANQVDLLRTESQPLSGNDAQERDAWFSRLQPDSPSDEIIADRDNAFNFEVLDALFASLPRNPLGFT